MTTANRTTHTPGPWRTHGCRHIEAGDNIIIAAVQPLAARDVQLGNQRLMAAAPEMLEALRGIVGLVRNDEHRNWSPSAESAIDSARAAIAKAEGTTP